MARKVYVTVTACFDADGDITPLSIRWEDGRTFEIDRVLEVREAASLKVSGQGLRFTCRILGHVTHLFLDDDRWFVEGKE